ncbi:MAG: extracellular solute-binding protein [Clostridia bacterium]|nr:extracellular solute-binding protein [Clostridia bacterium]
MKKLCALFLVCITLISLFASCAETGEQPVDTTVAEESTDPVQLDRVPAELKFDGEDVTILSRSMFGWTADEIAVPEQNSDPVNDAMFNRNVTISDRLGVNIVSCPIDDPNQHKPIEEIKRAVKAGSDEYDLLAASAYAVTAAVSEGTFYDLTNLTYLDLDQSYWMQGYNESMSFLGKQYTATGDIALSTYRFTFVTLFNKDEFDNSSVPYLYEAVSNEEWTLDYQASLAKNFYRDINGSGKKDEGDFFGLITCPGICTDPYWASCDLSVVEKDADGYYEYVVDIAQLSDVMDKILNLYYDCGGTNLYLPEADNAEQDKIRNLFAKGECAMTTLRLVAVEQGDVRNMEQQYGIVPIPKYSTDQKGYRSQMHDQFTVFAIPSSAAQNRLEMLGATLEVMASESARTVKPAYYEIAVKRKYMSDPVAWEMLDLIFANVKVDPGLIYTNSLEKPLQTLRDIAESKQNTVSSSYEKMRSKAKKSLAKLNSKLEDLE